MTEYLSDSPERTIEIGREIAKSLSAGDCVLYKGEMGAGKTHLTKGIALYFGAGDVVSSPTFALVNEYEGDIPIFHYDLFRINTIDDLYATGFFDYLDRGGITLIEWSENIPGLEDYIENVYIIEIEKRDIDKRYIRFSRYKEDIC